MKHIESGDKPFSFEDARNKRIQNFHSAAEEATKIELGNSDKDIESLLKEVKGTNILHHQHCCSYKKRI